MQVAKFHDGGYVVHKIILGGYKGRFSAWFDKSRTLLDAEQLIGDKSRPVKRNGPAWSEVQRIGESVKLD
jgi:hypothetical protein